MKKKNLQPKQKSAFKLVKTYKNAFPEIFMQKLTISELSGVVGADADSETFDR